MSKEKRPCIDRRTGRRKVVISCFSAGFPGYSNSSFSGQKRIIRFVPRHLLLFPLNSADGLGSQVHQNTVDTGNLVSDAVGDLVQNGVGDLLDGGGHGILGVDSTDDSGPAS